MIAPCYVRLLAVVRKEFLKADIDEDNCMELRCSRRELDDAVGAYLSQLPSFDDKQPDWDVLVEAVYDVCVRTNTPVFPSVRQQEDTPDMDTWSITWLPATGTGEQKVCFSEMPLEEDKVLQDVLVTCGMTLVTVETVLIKSLKRAALPVEILSPESVMSFFASYSSDSPSCQLGELPVPLEESPFRDMETLQIVLKYCQQDPKFVSRLDGATLLLTADNVLRVFDSDTPVYHSDYEDLAPHSKHCFLHDCMRHDGFDDVFPTDAPGLSSLTIRDLANLLEQEFPLLHNTGSLVKWSAQDNTLPHESWLGSLWDFVESQVTDDNGLLPKSFIEARLSPLNQWCLIAVRVAGERFLMHTGMASTVIDAVRDPKLDDVLRKMNLPELDLASMKTGNADYLIRLMVVTTKKPDKVLGIVHRHMDMASRTTLNKSERHILLTYFCDNLESLQKNDYNYENHLKGLFLYTTVCSHVLSLAGSMAYTLPKGIPTAGMDVWRTKSGIVFLWQKKSLTKLYDAVGCASLTHDNVYCDFIFKHLEYLSSAERWTHLEYIYTNFMQTTPPPNSAITDKDRENVVSALRGLPILEGSPNGDLQSVNDFYDSDNEVFQVMLPADRFPLRPQQFFQQTWTDFLCQLGLQREVTPHMYSQFAKQVALEGATNNNSEETARKSRVLVKHLFAMEDTQSKLGIMQSIADIAFVPEARVNPAMLQLHPQRAAGGRYIAFSNSVTTKHAIIAWTQAQLLPAWADPDDPTLCEWHHAADVKKCLGIADNPPIQVVAMHLRTLCENETNGNNFNKQRVFRSIYSHLQTHGLKDPDVHDILSNTPCVLVEDGNVVFANQTVINMYDTDEIRPYLYKLPLYLGEFSPLFQALGATERATADQYCSALTHMHTRTRNEILNPNEYLCAVKLMAGLFKVFKEGTPDVVILFLLSESGTLVQSTRLVFNDAPAYYERAGTLLGLQFLARLQECWDSRLEESLCKLPSDLQLKMLSSVVSERLMNQCQLSESTDGLAARLSARLRSAVFLGAIDRLARHEAHRRGIEPDTARIADATDRLSTINVHGVVGDVVTELVYKDESVVGSQLKKTCFVEKRIQWHVYVSSDAELSLDLLVPLADVINEIMSSLLRNAVLYLLPIISCQSEDDINTALNNLNVREHHATVGIGRVLQLGDPIPETKMACLMAGERDFDVGEYVGYKEDDTEPIVYGIIKEQRMSPSDCSTYIVTIADSSDVMADDVQLYKFVRN